MVAATKGFEPLTPGFEDRDGLLWLVPRCSCRVVLWLIFVGFSGVRLSQHVKIVDRSTQADFAILGPTLGPKDASGFHRFTDGNSAKVDAALRAARNPHN